MRFLLITFPLISHSVDQQPSSLQPLSWSKKLTKSTENCYNIQEGKVIERGLKGRYISPVRIKNKNSSSIRSASPTQSITSIRTIPTSTPTHQSLCNINTGGSQTLNWRILQREKLALNADKSEADGESVSRLSEERGPLRSVKSDFSKSIGGYSVPYREKRNPLSSTRLSCYKPLPDKKFDNLKNYKSVDDFLSLDATESPDASDVNDTIVSMPFIASSNDLSMNSPMRNSSEALGDAATPKMSQQQDGADTLRRMKKHGISSKLRSMSDKTQKLFSRLYSNPSLKSNSSSSDVCNDFIIQRPVKAPSISINSRRSLSYGTLPGVNEFEIKKIEAEDGDSGILVNESGASSMVETDSGSDDPKTEIEVIEAHPNFQDCETQTATLR